MTRFIKYLLVIATVSPHRCFAQELLINYTTELQSDFKKGTNWVNLLRLDNSSCGIFPTLSADYPIANYPVSSMGVHYELQQAQWLLQASLYNGKGSYRFTGKENVFRFCPQHDGILCLISFNYRHHDSNYHMGFALHSGMYRNYAKGDTEQASKKEKKEIRKIIWGYAEQSIAPRLQVLLQVSAQWHASQGCSPPCI